MLLIYAKTKHVAKVPAIEMVPGILYHCNNQVYTRLDISRVLRFDTILQVLPVSTMPTDEMFEPFTAGEVLTITQQ